MSGVGGAARPAAVHCPEHTPAADRDAGEAPWRRPPKPGSPPGHPATRPPGHPATRPPGHPAARRHRANRDGRRDKSVRGLRAPAPGAGERRPTTRIVALPRTSTGYSATRAPARHRNHPARPRAGSPARRPPRRSVHCPKRLPAGSRAPARRRRGVAAKQLLVCERVRHRRTPGCQRRRQRHSPGYPRASRVPGQCTARDRAWAEDGPHRVGAVPCGAATPPARAEPDAGPPRGCHPRGAANPTRRPVDHRPTAQQDIAAGHRPREAVTASPTLTALDRGPPSTSTVPKIFPERLCKSKGFC